MEEKILFIGKLIQEGIEGEAEALKDYNRELAEIYAINPFINITPWVFNAAILASVFAVAIVLRRTRRS